LPFFVSCAFFTSLTNEISNYSIVTLLNSFNFPLIIILILLGIGIDIEIFHSFRVNYIYIFQINPDYRKSPYGIIKKAVILLALWTVSFVVVLAFLRYNIFSNLVNLILSWVMIVVILIILFNPFNFYLLPFRQRVIKIIFKCLFPIGKFAVFFRDFVFADILTSFTRPLQSIYLTVCFSMCSSCINNLNYTYNNTCEKTDITPVILCLIPYSMRFFQCLNKWYYTGDAWPHMFNAIKYSMAIAQTVLLTFMSSINPFAVYIVAISASLYLLFWDIKMDWDLGHFYSKNFFLRDKLMYSKWTYWFLLISNLILRFTWLYNIFITNIQDEIKIIVFSILEIFRRGFWVLYRVENENINNFEKYRTVLDIPELKID